MEQRRAARRAAALSILTAPAGDSPPLKSSKRHTPTRRTDSLNQYPLSDSSSSPDSLYSNGSPTLPDPVFEYDGGEDIQQHDEAEYESLMAESAGWQTPAWGAWPEIGGATADWTPSPTQHHSPSGGTIISISPAGSLNGRRNSRGSPSVFRSGGTGKSSENGRRGSDASLLGFNLNSPDRRRFLPTARRRSSVLSNGSVMDPVEDARLRQVNSMSQLRRRFSEVVEIPVTSNEGHQDTLVARQIMSQWSPYTDASEADDDDDGSEIHTAPYIPTPPAQYSVPTVLSNFPLASTASQPVIVDSSSEMLSSLTSSPGSPTYNVRTVPRIPLPPPPRTFATPPPPDQPSTLLRERVRPTLARAITEYQFPPRSDIVPAGTTTPKKPVLHRSVSTPFFSATAAGREAPVSPSSRVPGISPVHRPAPLGVSPLRVSTRRQSIASDGGESRRGSIAEIRKLSLALGDRRRSVVKEADLRRVSMDRRLSIEIRRMSTEGRKLSVEGILAESRRVSRPLPTPPKTVKRPSNASIYSTPSSAVSRKSSVVSVTEYGYLAPQIVIDAAPILEAPQDKSGFRRNAPPSIVLPEFSFSSTTPTPTPSHILGPDVLTPRFHPLDSFLGRTSPNPGMSATPPTVCPLSPSPVLDEAPATVPSVPSTSPRPNTSIMDRGRPLSPPEFRDIFPSRFRSTATPSPKSSPVEPQVDTPIPTPPPVDTPRAPTPPEFIRQVSRKAVPKMSKEQLVVEEKRDQSMRRRSRRGAVGQIESVSALAREVAHILEVDPVPTGPIPGPPRPSISNSPSHRRAISTDQSESRHRRTLSTERSVEQSRVGLGRPTVRRQVTLPPQLGMVTESNNRDSRKSHVVFEENTWRTPAHLQSGSSTSASNSPVTSPIPRPHSRVSNIYSPAPSHSSNISYNYIPSPNPRVDVGQFSFNPLPPPPPPTQPLEKSVLKRSSVTFSTTTQSIPQSSGSTARPGVGRASSFTRFFKSRPQSISGPIASSSSSASKPVRPSLRPMSSDVAGLGHSWRG